MEIGARIESDFKEALKKRDKIVVSALRMLKSAIHNKDIEKKGKGPCNEAEIIQIVTKQAQQHLESIEHFKRGAREELVEKESKELEILKRYLPKQLPEEEVAQEIKKIILEVQAQDQGQADFGAVMKLAMTQLKGKADGRLISQIVARQLNKCKKQ